MKTSYANKPLALDLCCGKGGWTNGLLKAGWDVIGLDIEEWEGYPGNFYQMDVRGITKDWVRTTAIYGFDREISLVVASPPCQEFSYSSFPFKRAREKFTKENPPDRSIWDACVRIAKELNAPLILENVRGAQKWMGKAQAHYGSFYLWGDVPVLLPVGKPVKGFQNPNPLSPGKRGPLNRLRHLNKTAFPRECERKKPVTYRGPDMSKQRDSYKKCGMGNEPGHSTPNARKEWSAKAAMIPEELAFWIGQCFYPAELKKDAE